MSTKVVVRQDNEEHVKKHSVADEKLDGKKIKFKKNARKWQTIEEKRRLDVREVSHKKRTLIVSCSLYVQVIIFLLIFYVPKI